MVARHASAWREAGAKIIAYREELAGCREVVDVALDRGWRFSRTVDFLRMAGPSTHSCALRCKTKPAILFLGPALSRAASGWPGLEPCLDDHSYENRLLGAVGLRHLTLFRMISTWSGAERPGAGRAIALELDKALQAA